MKIALVWNNGTSRVVNWFGQPCPEKYGQLSVDRVAEGLREAGHEVEVIQGDANLLDELDRFFPRQIDGQMPDGMVFNMAYGIQGDCRYTHVPAALEMAGVPYTGSSPMGHALALDKVITKVLIREAGVPTPRWLVAASADVEPGDLRFPLIVKPRHESTSFGLRVVHDVEALRDAVENVVTQFSQDALVEEFISGREVCIGLLGNAPPECLPPVELDFAGRDLLAFTWEDKTHKRLDEPRKICPASLPDELTSRLREMAVATFQACHCRDYARVDFRIDPSGNPYVLEINSMASLGGGASFVLAAKTAGHTFSSLVDRIVQVAHQRHLTIPVPEGPPVIQTPQVVQKPAPQAAVA
ncbi:MAG: ATP-grasp domain-containing protein [Pirellulales bacterium]|nr:ATP-grasp domain-containing protein [Pirellulales bacterium]